MAYQLYTAAFFGNVEEVKLLLKTDNTVINQGMGKGDTSLCAAAQPKNEGETALFIAAKRGHCKVVELLPPSKKLKKCSYID